MGAWSLGEEAGWGATVGFGGGRKAACSTLVTSGVRETARDGSAPETTLDDISSNHPGDQLGRLLRCCHPAPVPALH